MTLHQNYNTPSLLFHLFLICILFSTTYAAFQRKIPSRKPSNVASEKKRVSVTGSGSPASLRSEGPQFMMASNDPVCNSLGPSSLAFLTPWHHKAYSYQIPFRYMAPVWFQITPNDEKKSSQAFRIEGNHNINVKWMKKMRLLASKCGNVAPDASSLIVPRFSLHQFTSQEHYVKLFVSQKAAVIQQIVDTVQEHRFDGVTLELGFLQFGTILGVVESFLMELSRALKSLDNEGSVSSSKQVVLVIPSQEELISHKEVLRLAPYVDRFFVMTYDYSLHRMGANQPGPVAPLFWMRDTMQRLSNGNEETKQKLIMGLNFYGYNYKSSSVEPVIGDVYLKLLKQHQDSLKKHYNREAEEHFVEYTDTSSGERHTVYYPTEQDIRKRVDLAKELGVGIGIWELGQGLQEFFTVLED